MTLKLYYDLMSQPSRALYILLKAIKYNFEAKYVDLRKGAHFSDDFTNKVNRFQRVPVIDHDGFIVMESVAILKYLAREGIIPESLYPRESKKQARVEEFLEWQHVGIRLHCSMYFRVKNLDPIIMGREPDPKQVAGYERRMINCLELFETKWLGQGYPFLTGDNITVADLLAACEIEQPRMAGFDAMLKYPNIAEWMKRVRAYFSPYYEEGHEIVNKIVKKNEGKQKEAKSKL